MHLFRFLLLVSSVSAFAPSTTRFGVSQVASTQRFMFSKDDDNKPAPLATMDEPEGNTPSTSASKGSIVKDMNTGEIREVKWQDPAMLANTNLVMDWWAALLIAVPSTLLLDDFFHFLPKGMFLVN